MDRNVLIGIRDVAHQLAQLGFGEDWEEMLQQYFIYVTPGSVPVITLHPAKEKTKITYQLFFGINEDTGKLQLTRYNASLEKAPTIRHRIVDGLNTRQLEHKLKRLDWQFDYRTLEEKQELNTQEQKQFYTYAFALYNLIMLAAHEKGEALSEALRLKYLRNTPYEERYLSDAAKSRWEVARTFWVDGAEGVTKKEAYNLLSGRAVFKKYITKDGENAANWFKVLPDTGKYTEGKISYFFGRQIRYPPYDLEQVIREAPVVLNGAKANEQMLLSLKQGDRYKLEMVHSGKKIIFSIAADPEHIGVSFYDVLGQPTTLRKLQQGVTPEVKQITIKKQKGKRKGM